MERYITFIRDISTGEEFVSTRRAGGKAHEIIMREEMKNYPTPKYKVHTTYTESELKDVLESVRRMGGSSYMVMGDKVNVAGKEAAFKTGVTHA